MVGKGVFSRMGLFIGIFTAAVFCVFDTALTFPSLR
jgi:hypothetical protein